MRKIKIRKSKRWVIANILYISLFFYIIIFSYIDSKQIIPFFEINTDEGWELYNKYTAPSFIFLWVMIILLPAFVYWLFTRDKSESIGLGLAGLILLYTGLEDIIYFVFSPYNMISCMQWFNDASAPVSYYSTYILRESCVSPFSLISFSIIGIIISYTIFYIFKKKL